MFDFPELDNLKVGIIGLGYVGLPLALAFDKHFSVIGFDISEKRINQLKDGIDVTKEVNESHLRDANLNLTSETETLHSCDVFVFTVPTPVDRFNQPDLTHLENACRLVGRVCKPQSIMIFEFAINRLIVGNPTYKQWRSEVSSIGTALNPTTFLWLIFG